MKTSNSGVNWYQILEKGGNDMFFLNQDTGYIPSFKTTNGGINWVEQDILIMENSLINGMFFLNANTGFMVGGYSGAIIRTTDGGGLPVNINQTNNQVPSSPSLSQNYPNPFNPVTRIKYDVPAVGQRHAFDVRLIIYDILGREIETLVNETRKPGSYEVQWDGSRYASGVYFYRLITENLSVTKRMVLIK